MQKTAVIVGANLTTATIALQCLSPTQAGDLISPYVRSSGSAYYPGEGGLDVITVRATPKELQEVKRMVGQFDKRQASVCQIVGTIQVAPIPK